MPRSIARWFAGIAVAIILLPAPALFLFGLPQWLGWLIFWACLLVLSFARTLPLEVRGLLLIAVSVLCAALTPLYVNALGQDHAFIGAFVTRIGEMYYLIGGGVGGNFIAHGLVQREGASRAQ